MNRGLLECTVMKLQRAGLEPNNRISCKVRINVIMPRLPPAVQMIWIDNVTLMGCGSDHLNWRA
jgi:hypothetical protein